MQDFIVVDTEGSEELSEIAIVDRTGRLIYEGFVQQQWRDNVRFNVKPLRQILLDFFELARSKRVICHYAEHDIQVLKNSCRKVKLHWQESLQFDCTYELSQAFFPNLSGYSLEYLSKKFNLKVKQNYFNSSEAHSARYDAAFTYQLYRRIMNSQVRQALAQKPNPFSSSRVDTPFQDHPDRKEIYQREFELLKSTILDIKADRNHQSRGIVLIGEPGAGKTHLMMRLAKELLRVNRLLFIRQPNNSDSVLYHVYSRILESFVEKVPDNGYTQLENLLAHSFVQLISKNQHLNSSKADQSILAATEDNYLNLYKLFADNTDRKRALWQHIERRTTNWWASQYGLAGFSPEIIRGIVKFCSYSEPRRKQFVTRWLAANELEPEEVELIGLSNWNEELGKEGFSLEAISVFSKLSLLDEPLIIIFDQLEGLGLHHNEKLLLSFGEAVKEIFTHVPNSLIILNLFPDRWQQFREVFDGSVVDRISQHEIYLQRPNNDEIKKILQLKIRAVGVELEDVFTPDELQAILNQRSIRSSLNCAADYYRYKVHGIALPESHGTWTSDLVFDNAEPKQTVEQRLDRLEQEFNQFQQVMRGIAQVFNLAYLNGSTSSETATISPSSESLETASIASNPIQKHPLIEYLQHQKILLEEEYDRLQIITDSDDLGKLIAIAEAFKSVTSVEIDYLRLGKKRLPEHLVLNHEKAIAIGFLQVDGTTFTSRIKNWNELVVNYKGIQFQLYRDVRMPEITGKVAKEEIEKLNNAHNGQFILLEKNDRLSFELLYKLITDIQNRDLEFDLKTALEIARSELKDDRWMRLF